MNPSDIIKNMLSLMNPWTWSNLSTTVTFGFDEKTRKYYYTITDNSTQRNIESATSRDIEEIATALDNRFDFNSYVK